MPVLFGIALTDPKWNALLARRGGTFETGDRGLRPRSGARPHVLQSAVPKGHGAQAAGERSTRIPLYNY